MAFMAHNSLVSRTLEEEKVSWDIINEKQIVERNQDDSEEFDNDNVDNLVY